MRYLKGIWCIGLLWAVSLASPAVASVADGVEAYERGHYANAFQLLTPPAEDGDATAQYYVALMFDEGQGLRSDPVQAREWYGKAARAGHPGAQFRLGRLYAEGKGGAADGNKASYWYLQAASQGYLDAQYSLGAMFKQGAGVPVDLVQAYLWFSRAADQGLANAGIQRDFLDKKLTPEQLAEAKAILADVENAKREAERQRALEEERERQRMAAEAAARKAREEEQRRAQAEAARQAAEAEAARQAAVQQARDDAERAKARAEAEAQARKAEEERAQAAAAKEAAVQARNTDMAQLQALFEQDFNSDAQEQVERLKKFNPDMEIVASRILSIDNLKVTEMTDGTSMVYIKYQMQKLLKGAGEPEVKSASKWLKVRRGEQGFELVPN